MALFPFKVLGQLTTNEMEFVANLAGLTYATGDVLYYDGADITNLAIGTSGQVLSVSPGGIVEWKTVAGTGDVTAASAFGTDNVMIKSDGTGKGVQATGITIADTTDAMSGMASITIDASGSLLFGAVTIFSDSAGTMTLSNIDALDATTIATIQAALSFGNVSKVGTPLNNQVGVWTGDGTIEGDAGLTFDTATDLLTTGILNATSLTASEIVITDASKNLVSAAVATYPSLTELTYLKGVTSAIQTQLNAKGTGNVSKVGTPVDNQIGVWTGDGTIEGDASLTYDGTNLNLATAKNFQIAGATVLADAAGTTTLSNIDALDATTEATIEGAIDTLANLTSIQGRTVTLADAGANAVFGWDDVAGAYENLTAGEVRGAIGLATTDSPMFTAIELGHASDTTISRSAAGVLAVEGVVVPTISSTNTLTNKRITKRTGTTTSSATPTINTDNVDEYYITAQTEAITSFTTNLSGTPTLGQTLFISVIGTGARAITWGASFANGPVALPTTTVTTTQLSTLFKWDGSVWRCYATGSIV